MPCFISKIKTQREILHDSFIKETNLNNNIWLERMNHLSAKKVIDDMWSTSRKTKINRVHKNNLPKDSNIHHDHKLCNSKTIIQIKTLCWINENNSNKRYLNLPYHIIIRFKDQSTRWECRQNINFRLRIFSVFRLVKSNHKYHS